MNRLGKPVLSLDYLMDTIVTKLKPLDWEVFWNKQKDNTQVLKVSLRAACAFVYVLMSARVPWFCSSPGCLALDLTHF
jgi:hypothetical protein